jgi:hypothetical protein
MATVLTKKMPVFFRCELCDYNTCKKSQFERHTLTMKHKMKHCCQGSGPKVPLERSFGCDCGKTYTDRTGLWKHKKKCNGSIDTKDQLIMEVLKQNHDFKELISEQNNKIMELANKPVIINNTTNNTTNNNKFNLNVFLNEKCKDAINIMDFVQSLQIELSELETIGKLGYVEGIGKIFIKGLQQLDVHKRPIHCSDFKREILYVKDQDAWEKDNDDKSKIKQAIKQIEHKNIKNIPEWINKYPDSKYADSPKNEQYMKIISNSMGGSTNEEDEKNFNKIIKKVASEVIIEKNEV